MRVGITLPQFRAEPETALAVARHAEAAGLDGVFVFDHLWPIAEPAKPSMHGFPLLGALAAETEHVELGTLVARVGLVPDAVLVNQFLTLQRLIGDRLIAGVGTGDAMSRDENEAYGVPYEKAAVRLARVDAVVGRLCERGVKAWIGGRSAATLDLAVAHAVPLNLWAPTAEELAARVGAVELTWGGNVDRGTDLAQHLARLAENGVTYAVCAPLEMDWADAVDAIASAASGARQ